MQLDQRRRPSGQKLVVVDREIDGFELRQIMHVRFELK